MVRRAHKYGWRTAHAGRGWVGGEGDAPVMVTAMAKGWPDLACVKAGHRIIFMELKKEQGVLEPEQVEWLQLLNCADARAIVVRPSDLRLGRVDEVFRLGSPL